MSIYRPWEGAVFSEGFNLSVRCRIELTMALRFDGNLRSPPVPRASFDIEVERRRGWTVGDVRHEITRRAARIAAPGNRVPTVGYATHDAHPYIEIDGDGRFHYKIRERGRIRRDDITNSIEELLYLVFARMTWSMAHDHAARQVASGDPPARQHVLDGRQLELLGKLDPNWRNRRVVEIAAKQPVFGGLRATEHDRGADEAET